MEERIKKINKVISEYFEKNTKVNWIAAKVIMPNLIDAGLFKKDIKNGQPFRKILRELDKNDSLNEIPFIHAERKDNSIYWYIVREGAEYEPLVPANTISKKQKAVLKRESSDEYYIIDLCDEILQLKASRQHTFDFLEGDLHKNGVTRTKLPLDAYYLSLNLVVEYLERQHTEEVSLFDKPDRLTVSGVSRGEQRKKYDERRRKVLKSKEIGLVEVDYSLFEFDKQKKLVRNKEKDIEILKGLLVDYIK